MTQVYGHSHKSQFIVLNCCTAVQTRSVPNGALGSPYSTAIKCFLGCLGQLIPRTKARRPGGGGGGLTSDETLINRPNEGLWIQGNVRPNEVLGATMSGFEIIDVIETSSQTHSVQHWRGGGGWVVRGGVGVRAPRRRRWGGGLGKGALVTGQSKEAGLKTPMMTHPLHREAKRPGSELFQKKKKLL